MHSATFQLMEGTNSGPKEGKERQELGASNGAASTAAVGDVSKPKRLIPLKRRISQQHTRIACARERDPEYTSRCTAQGPLLRTRFQAGHERRYQKGPSDAGIKSRTKADEGARRERRAHWR